MEFDEYLKSELGRPVGEHYNPEGNSSRAIVSRGLYLEILKQYKDYPSRCKYALSIFDGLDTPIAWFLQMPIMFLLSPILPVAAGFHWHRKSIGEYRRKYETYKAV